MNRAGKINDGKRRYKRFSVTDMDVRAKTLFASEVELLDISMSGGCVLSRRSLKLGQNCLLKLGCEGNTFALRCAVVWETLCGSERSAEEVVPLYKTGIAFRKVPSDSLVQLKDFIRLSGMPRELKLADQYAPSALRFSVQSHQKALLYYPKTSPVKKISLGGMLMELYFDISVEKKFPMALFLPNENPPIKFQGRVASCIGMDDRHSKHFDVGIEFLEMTENDRSRMTTFLDLLERTPHPENRPLVP